ncbi:hypothetical protein B9Z65_5950 [Elsinoe australis]|uniref:Chromosome transmission fidelity protein 8 n=1 Tax=Elsinoe australis TaxID=40998 RepID=A0A2P7YJM6_9PEZI|nr:hypothetical protein B9Z65_5950 [Elsinoe australis]
MPSIPLHPPSSNRTIPPSNPLPNLLQSPSGLAIVELQGTINFPSSTDPESEPDTKRQRTDDPTSDPVSQDQAIQVGRLVFPLYDAEAAAQGKGDEKWMKRVHFYVGPHQRMTGEVKKLGKPVAVIRRRQNGEGQEGEAEREELEIVEVVKYKIVFASRPEPVGATDAVGS